MALCTVADIRALDFNGTDFPNPPYTDLVLGMFIDQAELWIDAECWGQALAEQAARYLAAHLAATFKSGGGLAASSGSVTSESAGGLSRSYANVMSGSMDGALARTGYGQHFLMLRDLSPCGMVPMVLT